MHAREIKIPVIYDEKNRILYHKKKEIKNKTFIEAPLNLIDTYFNSDIDLRKAGLSLKDFEFIAKNQWPIINKYYHPDLHPNRVILTREELEFLIFHKDPHVRKVIAEREDLTPNIIEILLKDKASLVRSQVANIKNLSERNLLQLVEDKDHHVREALAKREHLPKELASILIRDKNAKVRAALATRDDLDTELIAKLSEDKTFQVRAAIAERKNLPKNLIWNLIDDVVPIRQRIANNEDTPDDILEHPSRDKDYKDKKMAMKSLNRKKISTSEIAEDRVIQTSPKTRYDSTSSIESQSGHIYQKTCPNCQRNAKIDDTFCVYCGRYLEDQ